MICDPTIAKDPTRTLATFSFFDIVFCKYPIYRPQDVEIWEEGWEVQKIIANNIKGHEIIMDLGGVQGPNS